MSNSGDSGSVLRRTTKDKEAIGLLYGGSENLDLSYFNNLYLLLDRAYEGGIRVKDIQEDIFSEIKIEKFFF